MALGDVDGEPSQDGEVLRGISCSDTAVVLVEDDVENPVQLVFDRPMAACDLQQAFGGDIFGEQKVADERLVGMLSLKAPAGRDAGRRCPLPW